MSKLKFIDRQKSWCYEQKQGALRIFRLMLEQLSYKPHDVLGTGLGSLLNLLNGPLHDWFKEDLGSRL
jgi:hypothetical protein